jgi:hypothetical protein
VRVYLHTPPVHPSCIRALHKNSRRVEAGERRETADQPGDGDGAGRLDAVAAARAWEKEKERKRERERERGRETGSEREIGHTQVCALLSEGGAHYEQKEGRVDGGKSTHTHPHIS